MAVGQTLEIAGYDLSPGLARQLDRVELKLESGYRGEVLWLEVSHDNQCCLSPGSAARVARLQEQGVSVQAAAVTGNLFWQSVEMAECPELVEATLRLMQQGAR